MMKKTCSQCQSIVVLDESKYTPGETVKTVCQLCGEEIEFTIPEPVKETVKVEPTPTSKHTSKQTVASSSEKIPPIPKPQNKPSTVAPTFSQTPNLPPKIVAQDGDKGGSGSNKKLLLIIIAVVLLAVVFGGYFYYTEVYLPEKIDRESPRTYPIVNVFLRSSKLAGGDFNKIATVPCGAELITYENDGEWASVKYVPTELNSEPVKGYVASPYLLDKQEFYTVNSIFGDADARETLGTAKVRRGLLDYYKKNSMVGKIPAEIAVEAGLSSSNSDQWQVFLHHGQSKPNEVYFKRAYNSSSKFTDMAVIIENVSTGNRKLLYFTYDDDETPHLRAESDYFSTDIKDYKIVSYGDSGDGAYLVVYDGNNNMKYIPLKSY